MTQVRIGLVQMNCMVGDVPGNARAVLQWANSQRDYTDLLVFPELTLTGYPPEDLLLHLEFRRRVEHALNDLRAEVRGTRILVGHPEYHEGMIYNACSVIGDGQTVATYRKRRLPNYGVFDEKRYFTEGSEPVVVDINGLPVGLSICEDAWHDGPIEETVAAGARLVVNVNASPFCVGKRAEREQVVSARAEANGVSILYLNLVGGQDELVFDGHSFAVGKDGLIMDRLPGFEEEFAVLGVAATPGRRGHIHGRLSYANMRSVAETSQEEEESSDEMVSSGAGSESLAPGFDADADVYKALKLAVHDYAQKNGFQGALVGLSGGLDSALTLAIAVDALGPQQVTAVLMPSRYTSELSIELAKEQVRRLGIKSHVVSIEEPFQAFLSALQDVFAGMETDVTEENIQARCRGVILMAISNKTGKLVLSTGNKSEYATGYATLYGDMAGGFAPLKDIYKSFVYRLARYRNRQSDIAPIPEPVLTREPSAELSTDQRDTDTLPPYPVLDDILVQLIERDLNAMDVIASGFEEDTVYAVARMLKLNEYKRRQAPPGVKISPRAFGRERRYPISSGYLVQSPASQKEDKPDQSAVA